MSTTTEAKIIEIMEKKNTMSVSDLAKQLNRTEVTIRRNLDKLQERNFVIRKHGFATLQKQAQATDFYQEKWAHFQEKAAIVKAASQFIQPNMNICVDSGTTTQQLIETITDKNITLSIITPSLTIASALAAYPNIQIFMPEGFLHHSNLTLLLTNSEVLNNYKADVAFMACRSFKPPYGAFENTPTMTMTKHALSKIADKIILLLDYSKWNISSLSNSIAMKDIDVIITDNKAPQDGIQICADLGKEVIVVDPDIKEIEHHYNRH